VTPPHLWISAILWTVYYLHVKCVRRIILETSADGALSVNQHWDMYCTSFTLHKFMAWCLVKHMDIVIFVGIFQFLTPFFYFSFIHSFTHYLFISVLTRQRLEPTSNVQLMPRSRMQGALITHFNTPSRHINNLSYCTSRSFCLLFSILRLFYCFSFFIPINLYLFTSL
jgi:hypothetical protein